MNIANQQIDYPRVLIVSPFVFNLYTGGGVTLSNFFYGWPEDKLAMIYMDSVPKDTSICKNFYELTSKDMRWIFPFSFFQKHNSKAACKNSKTNIKGSIFNFILGEEMPKVSKISESLKKWIDKFQPQVVYLLASNSVFYVDITLDIMSKFKIPAVVHIMDNWQGNKYKKGLLGPYLRHRLNNNLKLLLNLASFRLSICDYMSEAYKMKYDLEFIPFHNAVDTKIWEPKVRKSWVTGKPFRIMYHGTVAPFYNLDSILDVCHAVEKINKAGLDIEMFIHTPKLYFERYGSLFKDFSNVSIGSTFIEAEEIPSFLTKADLLLLPINFDKHSMECMRYSMLTKVPEYMMSGTPILLYGPPDTASSRYALKEKWGYVVTNRNLEELKNAIVNLMNDESLRKELGKRSQDLVYKNHDIYKVRREFQKIIINSAINV